ncbi:MAG: PVC-type heme-binding CxxCH protein [Gemmataceae bacterium]
MHRWPIVLLLGGCWAALFAADGDAPLTPQQAVRRMKAPEGFRVELVAGEPAVQKPIAMTTDERGRVWVVESHSYPNWITNGRPGKDRVLIFEPDRAGGWTRKVFLDNGTNLSGIAVGHGGVWLCAIPNLLFIPYRPGDDRPAGPPQVVLDGWSLQCKHNVVNGLNWGPDGWLYGMHGIVARSDVGAPGTPADKRTPLDCAVWRYHPTAKRFEVVASGTTNPWGLDWDEYGELFITNCVIKHLFHVVPGAHFVRMYGQDLNPNTYGLIESCADHIHWGGGSWTDSRGGKGAHSTAGGGHAHAGALFYLGDNWPATYRNRIFMCNLHGSRLNQDRLEPAGSSYTARHCDDFLFANDPWFRGLGLMLGADGGVFVSDWHDTGECHNYDKTHPSGRIYRVTFGSPRYPTIDLAAKSGADLVELQRHRSDWYVRQARRVLAERAAAGKLSSDVAPRRCGGSWKRRRTRRGSLQALWALHAIGKTDAAGLLGLLRDDRGPGAGVGGAAAGRRAERVGGDGGPVDRPCGQRESARQSGWRRSVGIAEARSRLLAAGRGAWLPTPRTPPIRTCR